MTTPERRSRARWVVIACGLGVLAVGVVGLHPAVRRVRESRAIEALDSEERDDALRELSGMKSLRAIPHILRYSLRRSACKAAKWLGPEAVKAVPHLISLVERESWDGQESAIEALVAISPENGMAAIRALEHDHDKVRDAR